MSEDVIFDKANLKVVRYVAGTEVFYQFIVKPDYFTTLSEKTVGELHTAIIKALAWMKEERKP